MHEVDMVCNVNGKKIELYITSVQVVVVIVVAIDYPPPMYFLFRWWDTNKVT